MQKIGFCERYMLTTAVLKRFKTNTRRLEKALERVVAEYEKQYGEPFEIITQYWDEKRKKVCCLTKHGIIHVGTRYKLGEVVAVAQQYSKLAWDARLYDKMKALCDGGLPQYHLKGWSNKMFVRPDIMPHQIKITGIKVERLQDITDEDCLKEGIQSKSSFPRKKSLPYYFDGGKHKWDNSYKSPREAFSALINRPGVGRKGLWESNPFVVVYEFKLVK